MELDAIDKLAAKAFEGCIVRKDLVRKFKGQYPARVDDEQISFAIGLLLR